MSQVFHKFYRSTMQWVLSLDRQEWLVVLIVVTVIGFFCMRGFGSRNNY